MVYEIYNDKYVYFCHISINRENKVADVSMKVVIAQVIEILIDSKFKIRREEGRYF